MRRLPSRPDTPSSLSIRLGDWLEAHATGWGIVAVALILVIGLLASIAAPMLG